MAGPKGLDALIEELLRREPQALLLTDEATTAHLGPRIGKGHHDDSRPDHECPGCPHTEEPTDEPPPSESGGRTG